MKKILPFLIAFLVATTVSAQKKSDLAKEIHSLDSALNAQTKVVQTMNENILKLTTLCSNQTMQINMLSDSLRSMQRLRDSVRALRNDLKTLTTTMDGKIAQLATSQAQAADKQEDTPLSQKDSIIYMLKKFIVAYNDDNKDEWSKYVTDPAAALKIKVPEQVLRFIKSSVRPITIKGSQWFLVGDRYYIKQVGNEYKVDFESSVIYNKVSLKEFETNKYTSTHQFRVTLDLDSETYSDVFDDGRYYSFNCVDASNSLRFYIKKNTSLAKQLFEMTKNGEKKNLIIEGHYIKETDPYGEYYDIQPVITKIVQESWVTTP